LKNDRIDGQGPLCIVDDDDWVGDALSAMLESHGFVVRAYGSGAALLADDRGATAKCLIDQHVPDLDSLSVVAELRRRDIVPPTILITGRLDAKIEQRAGEPGIAAVLEKPFAAAPLIAAIHRARGPRQ
jgi:two-component system, LuxR family, response regulator FixJ